MIFMLVVLAKTQDVDRGPLRPKGFNKGDTAGSSINNHLCLATDSEPTLPEMHAT